MKNASLAARLFGHSYATRLAAINSIFRHLVLFPHFPMEWRKLILTYVQVQQPSTTNKHIYQLIISTIQTSTDVVFYPTPTDAAYTSTYYISELTDFLDS